MSEPYIGQIQAYGFNFPPRGWAQCNGQLLPIAQNTALFSLLGTTYGGDGRTTFRLPDLRGRAPMHEGSGPGLSTRRLGQRGGTETNTLALNELPAHKHPANAVAGAGDTNVAAGNLWSKDLGVQSATYSTGAADATMDANAIGNAGGGNAVNNMQPYLALNFCIALVGIFPPRN